MEAAKEKGLASANLLTLTCLVVEFPVNLNRRLKRLRVCGF